MASMSFDKWQGVLAEFEAHWTQSMGETFTVGGMTLTQFKALRASFVTVLNDIADLMAQLDVKSGARDTMVPELSRILVNYRQAVVIAKGKGSPEHRSVPRLSQAPKEPAAKPGPPPA